MSDRCHLLLLLLACILSACSLPQPILPASTPTLPPVDTQTIDHSTSIPSGHNRSTLIPFTPLPPSPPAAATPSPGNAPAAISPPASYNLQAQFDYFNHHLLVDETICYTNQTGESLPDLLLVVHPLDWEDSFQLTTLTWEDGSPVLDFKIDAAQLHIPLPQSLEPGAQRCLQLSYQLDLPSISSFAASQRPLPYGYTERQTNLVDWYPYLPPYRPGEGWLVHPPGATGEHLVYDLADYQVQLTLTEPASGLVIAASAPAAQDGLTYSFSLPAARTFALSASPYYQILEQTVGETTISSYFFPYNAAAGQAALEATAQALDLYNELFGPYRRPSLSAVEADFQDGMEYSGLYFISRDFFEWYDGTPRGYLTLIAAHETAHQWWFDRVGNDQALEPWLDEALCTYMERLFFERLEQQNPSQDAQSLVDWWWYFRVDIYAPSGSLGSTIYDFSTFRAYRDAIYLRGAQFLEALRQQIGDEAFLAFLRAYASEMSGQQATSADFFRILEKYAGDVRGIRETYFLP